MSEEAPAADWAQLVCVTDLEAPPFLIGKDKFTIGRAQGCDICHEKNKLVSGTHCYLLRDESGKVWLYDSSTNGTLLNSKIKLSKGECRELEHGDEFFVVHKKGEESVNIGYVFQDLARLKEEEADDSGDLDQTVEYDDGLPQVDSTIADDSINRTEEEEPRVAVKRQLPSPAKEDPGFTRKRVRGQGDERQADFASDISSPATAAADAAATKEGKKVETGPDTAVEPPSKKKKEDEKEAEGKKADDGGVGDEKKEAGDGGVGDEKKEAAKSGGGGEEDMFAETLTCTICQELLHDCISLQPCMHSFCAGCYSSWMAHSSECPSCRGTVDRINKNHIVNNLVEAYLKEHPEKRRPEEDIKDLDAKNKITRDMLYPSKKRRNSSDYEDSDVDDEEEQDFTVAARAPTGTVFGFGTPIFGAAINAYRAVCRQCPATAGQTPGFISSAINTIRGLFPGQQTTATTTDIATGTTTSAATPSTSGNNNNNNDTNNNADETATSGAGPSGNQDYLERDKKILPTPPAYTCAVNQNHVLCQCCLQIFPDRRIERINHPEIPPQQCTICFRAYCHAYWGCHKADCNGCLAKFKDMNFGRKVLPGLIGGNQFESDIFTNYLDAKELAVRDVLETCIAKMSDRSYTCPDQTRHYLTGETPLCFACALRNFKALAYQYRADIPRDQLPDHVTKRPDCYWGKNCRTQHNKPEHARRFNHICEQTRT